MKEEKKTLIGNRPEFLICDDIVDGSVKEFNSFPTIITREGHSVGKTEEYHRSEHNDFATSKELKDRKFSGIRNNSITNSREIWVEGILSASMNEEIIRRQPQQWDRLYSEVFGLMEVITEGRE